MQNCNCVKCHQEKHVDLWVETMGFYLGGQGGFPVEVMLKPVGQVGRVNPAQRQGKTIPSRRSSMCKGTVAEGSPAHVSNWKRPEWAGHRGTGEALWEMRLEEEVRLSSHWAWWPRWEFVSCSESNEVTKRILNREWCVHILTRLLWQLSGKWIGGGHSGSGVPIWDFCSLFSNIVLSNPMKQKSKVRGIIKKRESIDLSHTHTYMKIYWNLMGIRVQKRRKIQNNYKYQFSLYTRSHHTFSVKDQIVNIYNFDGCRISAATTMFPWK